MDASYVFFALGVATATYAALRFIRFIYLYNRPSSIKRYLYGSHSWALVTGASDGIGRGIAQELAANGFNIILHALDAEELERTKAQLQGEHKNVQFKIAALDASTATKEQIEDLVASLEGLNLTVLVNNVGTSAKIQPLAKTTAEEVDSLINVNARFPTQLTRALLPKIAKRDRPALIMNISSMGDSCVPYATVYGGTKAFNTAMSRSLTMEIRAEGENIEVLAIPFGRVTDCSHSKEPSSFFHPSARTAGRACVARVGCGRPVVVGYVGHAMQKFMMDHLPFTVLEMFIVPVLKGKRWNEEKNKLQAAVSIRNLTSSSSYILVSIRYVLGSDHWR